MMSLTTGQECWACDMFAISRNTVLKQDYLYTAFIEIESAIAAIPRGGARRRNRHTGKPVEPAMRRTMGAAAAQRYSSARAVQ
jgi:hypothetical protein